jgi:cytochrome c-550 PedF
MSSHKTWIRSAIAAALLGAVTGAFAHGDVTPQPVDTKGLPALGEAWRTENPFRGNDAAAKLGASAYGGNCAACHGLDAVSGGITPDLRKLDGECAGLADAAKKTACVKELDEYFINTVRKGKQRNGTFKMFPFEGKLNQEAMWAIKTYLETRREKPL